MAGKPHKRTHKVRSRTKRMVQARKNNPPTRGVKPQLQAQNRQLLTDVLRRLKSEA